MPCKTFRQSKISKFNDIINGISIDFAYSQTEEKNERAAIRGKFLNDDFHGIERAPHRELRNYILSISLRFGMNVDIILSSIGRRPSDIRPSDALGNSNTKQSQ